MIASFFRKNKEKKEAAAAPRKICLFGGTFDPIHLGHLRMAEKACMKFSLDEMIFMPSGDPYLKTGVSPDEDRFEITKRSVSEYIHDDKALWRVSDMEIKREGETYTFETIAELKTIYPGDQLYFLVGEDSLRYMEHWKDPQLIFADCIVIAAARPSRKSQRFDDSGHEITGNGERNVERIEDLQARLMRMFPAEIHIMDFSDKISSSDIRNAIREGRGISDYVTASAEAYIKDRGMYQ